MVDVSADIFWESGGKILRSWTDVLFFTSFYLESCIWPDEISQWTDKGKVSNVVKISGKVRRRPLHRLDKRSGKKVWAVHGKSKFTETEKGERGEEQSQEHAHHFLWHQGDCSQIIHSGRPSSQFPILPGRFTPREWKCANISPPPPNFGVKRTGCSITTSPRLTLPFSPGNF
jgi:hypothetical protein